MIATFFAGFACGAIAIVVAGACVAAHERARPWDRRAFREAELSLSGRRRAIRRGMELAGPMPVGGCSDEQWN